MEDTSRRELFKIIGTTLVVSPAFAQHVHDEVAAVKSLSGGAAYPPKGFTKHNFQTLRKLAETIVPGANEAGAAEYIDFLASRSPELAAIFNGGFGWLDTYTQKTYSVDFLTAKPEQQTAILDKLAYKKNQTPDVGPGVVFFTWVRNMTVDAYYTSPAGVKDVGYMGNGAMSTFSVPKEAVDYAIKRSPFANEG